MTKTRMYYFSKLIGLLAIELLWIIIMFMIPYGLFNFSIVTILLYTIGLFFIIPAFNRSLKMEYNHFLKVVHS